MTLKRKIAFNIAISFSIIFGVVLTVIYLSFYKFRKNEFRERLEDRTISISKFVNNIKDFDPKMLKIFDAENNDPLYQEQTLVFDSQKVLIYSSIINRKVVWDENILKKLDQKSKIFTENNGKEILGVVKKIDKKKFYIITQAEDIYGNSKLSFLKYLLMFCYFLTTTFVGIFSYLFVEKQLKPLEKCQKEITKITAQKLTTQLPENKTNDEISILARAFNTMILRLNDAFLSQKEFTASASHEIRTPLTRMAFQLENLKNSENHSDKTKATLQKITDEVHQLSDLTNSLLLLSKFDKENIQNIFTEERIDEIIFDSYETILKNFPNLKLDFIIENNGEDEPNLFVKGNKSLLEIVFNNLLKNAALYSENEEAKIRILDNKNILKIEISNSGKTISEEEQSRLFEAFMRGENSQNINGSGLGLRIVKRILEYHKADIIYQTSPSVNLFIITFYKS